jgi:uncharacterized membrane protein
MDWIDIIRIIGVIIVWLCVAVDIVLLIYQIKRCRKINKNYDEAIEALNRARKIQGEAIMWKELYEQHFKENEPLTSEEN